jgi:hypothetical protein
MNNNAKTKPVEWLVNQMIKSRNWEETQSPFTGFNPTRPNHCGLCSECEMRTNLKCTDKVQELIDECSSSHSGSVISVPAFEITVCRNEKGEETYTVEISAKKHNN